MLQLTMKKNEKRQFPQCYSGQGIKGTIGNQTWYLEMEGSSHCAVFFKKHEEKTLFNNLLSGYSKRNYFFVTKSIFLIPISSQPDGVNL